MTMYNEVMKYKEDSFEVRLRHLKFSRLLEVTQSLILLYYATFFKPIVKSSSVFGFEIKIWFISLIREKMWYKVKLVTLLRIQFCIVCNNSNFFWAQKSLNGSKGPTISLFAKGISTQLSLFTLQSYNCSTLSSKQ